MGKFSKDNVKQELVEWGIMGTPSQGGELALSTSAKIVFSITNNEANGHSEPPGVMH